MIHPLIAQSWSLPVVEGMREVSRGHRLRPISIIAAGFLGPLFLGTILTMILAMIVNTSPLTSLFTVLSVAWYAAIGMLVVVTLGSWIEENLGPMRAFVVLSVWMLLVAVPMLALGFRPAMFVGLYGVIAGITLARSPVLGAVLATRLPELVALCTVFVLASMGTDPIGCALSGLPAAVLGAALGRSPRPAGIVEARSRAAEPIEDLGSSPFAGPST